jgi:EpsI family protein
VTPVRWLTSIGLLGATLLYLQFFTAGERVLPRKRLESFPVIVDGWRSVESVILEDDVLDILKPSDYLVRRYIDSNGKSASLYIGYWESQRKGAQMHSPKNCLPGEGWEPIEATRMRIPVLGGDQSIEVNRYLLQKEAETMIVLYWFQSQGRPTTSELRAKIDLVKNAMLHHRTDGAIVRVSSPVYRDARATDDSLVKFAQAVYPRLGDFLPD